MNLAEEHPEVISHLLSLLEAQERRHTQDLKSNKVVIDEELREKLKALGYVQ